MHASGSPFTLYQLIEAEGPAMRENFAVRRSELMTSALEILIDF